jgi:hypothetical protein
MQPRIAVLLAIVGLGLASAPAAAQGVPVVDLSQAGTRVVINGGPGDHFDPHLDGVDGDLVSYSSVNAAQESEIRHYRFSTGLDLGIPRCGGATPCYETDLLSDVAGGTISFTRVVPTIREAVFLFDTTVPGATPVEIDPQPSSHRIWTSLGARTLAVIDTGLTSDPFRPGEVMAFDRAAGGPPSRLTIDTVNDGNPAVSPDGDVLVWERCPGSLDSCEIRQALRQPGGSWTVAPLASAPANNPATNGTLVVYERPDPASPTGSDIYYRRLGGGAEVRIALPGEDFHPRIAGNVISFEHRDAPAVASDIYLFDVSTGLAYRITDTPAFNESLNDVAVLANGEVRVVWQSTGQSPDPRLNTLYGATVSLYDLDTVITSSPPAVTNSTLATFSFTAAGTAPPAALTFECSLDGRPFVACASPTSYAPLAEGAHAFAVRAKSPAGPVDPTPAEFRWTVDASPPVINLRAPSQGASYRVKSSVLADFDCADAVSGVAFCDGTVPPGSPIDTTSPGLRPFTVNAGDAAGNTGWTSVTYRVVWAFKGFFPPLRNPPVLNVARAGQVIPVAFSLTGDFGRRIFARGYPVSVRVDCGAPGRSDPRTLRPTMTPWRAGLKYDPRSDRYSYPWRTSPGWDDTCRQLIVRLRDGTEHSAYVRFR